MTTKIVSTKEKLSLARETLRMLALPSPPNVEDTSAQKCEDCRVSKIENV
jgi:hypothetical protein